MKCPICKKEADSGGEFYPFCSERCKIIDLGNWASEKYVISSPAFDESMFEDLEKGLSGADEDSTK